MERTDREKLQYILTLATDFVSILASTLLVWWVLGPPVLGLILPYDPRDMLHFASTLLLAFLCAFLSFHQSENITTRKWPRELWISLQFNALLAAALAVLLLVTKAEMLDSRYLFIGIPTVNTFFMLAAHQLLKRYLRSPRGKTSLERLVGVVSTTDRAPALIASLQGDWSKKVDGLALLDAAEDKLGTRLAGIKIVANDKSFLEWIRRAALDEIYIDIPYDTGASLMDSLEEIESTGVDVHLNLPVLDNLHKDSAWLPQTTPTVERCGNKPMLSLRANRLTITDLFIKRVMDIVGALVGCIISIPIIAIVAIPLKLESPGPLFFKQRRVGLNGRFFYIYKLRSMYQDAEQRKKDLLAQNEMTGLMFKMEDDPRVTRVGKFIRKTSIDELPQFFCALTGKMSLVGTRPPTLDEYEHYKSHHKYRLSMKPGITGLWQVSGRSDIEDFEEVVKLDTAYIENWSLWLDIKILCKTIVVVFAGNGAK